MDGGCIIYSWTVLEQLGKRYTKCVCVCGTERKIRTRDLEHKKTKSCGCQRATNVKKAVKEKYGVNNIMELVSSKAKMKETNLERYGTEYAAASSEIKNKIIKTNIEKYGKSYTTQVDFIKDKMKNSIINRYGVTSYTKTEEYIEKCKITNLKKYGCEWPTQNKNVRDKVEITNLRKYEVIHVLQNTNIAHKAAKSLNKRTIYYHWKTSEELIAVSSYECKVLEYLNSNRIDFDWQIKFELPNKKVYFCDLYLKNEDKYIEIKGYMRPKTAYKWEWFHEQYKNSELWTKDKLKELGIW